MRSFCHWAIVLAAFAVAVPVAGRAETQYDGWADFPSYPIDILADMNAALHDYTASVSAHGVGKKASSDTLTLRPQTSRLWHVVSDKSGVVFVRFQFRNKSGTTVCDTGEKRIVLYQHAKAPTETGHYDGKRCWVN